jgi:hypothetical protein
MTDSAASAATAESVDSRPEAPGRSQPGWPIDVLVCAGYLLVAGYLTAGLWQPSPNTRTLAVNPEDQVLIEWFMARASRFWVGDFSLVTDRLNAPDGINLMSNAAHILHGILLAPVIAIFGVAVAFALCVALNLAGTAIGWYFVFSRLLGAGRAAAAVGALLCGFGPAMITQSNGHLHVTAQWLVPLIVYCVVRIYRGSRPLISGVALGLLAVLQVFLGEEVLFLTALTLAIFSVTYAIYRWPEVKAVFLRVAGGLTIAAGLAAVLLAYPLWLQFAGPQAVPHLPWSVAYVADLRSYLAFPPLSLFGGGLPAAPDVAKLALGPTEYNTFFGWPLVIIAPILLGWLWWSKNGKSLMPAVAVTAVVMAALSFGPHLVINGVSTTIWGPYQLIAKVPTADGALPTRYAMALLPLIGLVITLALNRALSNKITALLVPAAVTVALVPLVPLPLPTTSRPPVPHYFSSGEWKQCASPGQTIVLVPPADPKHPGPMRWAAAAGTAFAMPEGFFLGPYAAGGGASFGIYPTATSQILSNVERTGQVPRITGQQRTQARRDMQYWKSSCVVLGPDPRQVELRLTLQAIFGPGRAVEDVWVWKLAKQP